MPNRASKPKAASALGLTPERAAKLASDPATVPTEAAGVTTVRVPDPWDSLYERGRITAREADACAAVARAHERAAALGGPKSAMIAFEMPKVDSFGPKTPTDKTLAAVRAAQRLLAAAGPDWPMVWAVAVLGLYPRMPTHLDSLRRGLAGVAKKTGV